MKDDKERICKVSEAVQQLALSKPFILESISTKTINYTKMADYLLPEIEELVDEKPSLPAVNMATLVNANVKTTIIAVFSIPPFGVIQNNVTEVQEASKKTEPTGSSTLRAYDTKENATIRPTITTLDMSATMAISK